MLDESKRKKLIYASMGFIGIVILSFIGFLIFNNSSDLPPIEIESSDKATPITPEPTDEETTSYKNGVRFEKFNELSRYAVTPDRIDVIRYYLAEHAASQSTGVITAFTLDNSSIKESREGERNIYTFTATDNTNTPYKVELSYVYSTDAFVRIFDKDGNVIQTSPFDDH